MATTVKTSNLTTHAFAYFKAVGYGTTFEHLDIDSRCQRSFYRRGYAATVCPNQNEAHRYRLNL
jgi:hypothetical protein